MPAGLNRETVELSAQRRTQFTFYRNVIGLDFIFRILHGIHKPLGTLININNFHMSQPIPLS